MSAHFKNMRSTELKKEIENAVLFALYRSPEPEFLKNISRWDEVCRFLISRKLAGRFFHRLQNSNQSLVPESVYSKLKQVYQLFAVKNQLFLKELERIWSYLEKEIDELMIFKGMGLIISGFYHIGERYQVDMDFLVNNFPREKLRSLVPELGYLSVQHSDQFWWSEEHFLLKGSKGAGDLFSVFLEFHWDFKPINQTSGKELVEALLSNQERIEREGRTYVIPTAEIQFYLSAIHGSALHPFDSSYFWVSLMDLSTIASKVSLNQSLILDLAKKQRLIEHLAVMIYLIGKKLGVEVPIWERLQESLDQNELIEKTAEKIWQAFLRPEPLSLANFSLLMAKTPWREKIKALKEFAGISRGEKVEVENKSITAPRPQLLRALRRRFQLLNNKEFISLVWQMAKFYRKTNFRPIL